MYIRRAKEEDKTKVLEISSKIWDGTDYLPSIFDEWLNDQKGEFTVAEHDGTIIGCAKYTRFNEREAWLEGIRGDKQYAGLGFGEAMTNYYLEKAKNEKIEVVRLSTFVENYQSIHIIEKRGFKKDGYFSFFTKEIEKDQQLTPTENIISLMSTGSVWHFITNSNYYMMANGYISFGWKFLKMDYELIDHMVKEGRVLGTLKDGKITAVLILGKEPTDEKGISISYIDGDMVGIKKLLDYAANYSKKADKGFISVMSPLDEKTIELLELAGYRAFVDNPKEVNVFVYAFKL